MNPQEVESMLSYKRRAIEHTLQLEASNKPSKVVSPQEMLQGWVLATEPRGVPGASWTLREDVSGAPWKLLTPTRKSTASLFSVRAHMGIRPPGAPQTAQQGLYLPSCCPRWGRALHRTPPHTHH